MMKNVKILILLLCVFLVGGCAKNVAQQVAEQLELGQRYLEEGDYEAAIVAFTKAIEIDPKQAAAFLGRGDAYILSAETEETIALARADYEQALQLDETLPGAYLGLADLLIRQGDYDGAREILEEGLEKTDGDEEIQKKLEELESGNITDSAGHTRRQSGYDGNGALIWYHDFAYDEEGRRKSVTSYDASGAQTGHVDLAYTEDGKCKVNYHWTFSSGVVGRSEYEYDAAGNMTNEVIYENDGVTVSTSIVNHFDENNNLIEAEHYDGTGVLTSMERYEYNAQGQETRRNLLNPDGELTGYEVYSYNEDGKRSSTEFHEGDGYLDYKEIDRYDDEGKYIGFDRFDGDGNLIQSIVNE